MARLFCTHVSLRRRTAGLSVTPVMLSSWCTLGAFSLLGLQLFLLYGATVVSASRKSPVHMLRLSGLGSRLVVEIPEIHSCEVANNAITFANVHMGMLNKVDFVVDADLNVSRAASSLREVVVELHKCRDAVSANTCEYFQTWRFKDRLCAEWNDPTKPWNSVLGSIEPRLDCPIKQGEYHIRNGSLDLRALQGLPIPLEGSVWKVRASTMEENHEVHTCTVIHMEPHRVRD
ncbi:uncharacterized protein LOC127751591 isoform X2 [Frankliniella occidentalis]|uniref:Uncharacterized protein LOC113203953 isoform X2 n=1 Tax=Frankliniella occidentalis TaxID=133901 RepID=A0A6J1S0M5_FRAOC|nr:uncharacterized protein LOC113203953 isoform X2 [Frankliniella occidentalis]XP_052131316.1 uncharacterized protein LOC127751591 isoform X2 [Frankliniella occidentalis]